MGNVAIIDKVEGGVDELAAAWVSGATRADLAEMFGVTKDTITNWTGRDDVKMAAGKLIRDRVLKIKRKADNKIMEGLEQLDPKDDIEAILKIRKEFAGENIPDGEMSDDELLALAFEKLDENPELAEALQEAQTSDVG